MLMFQYIIVDITYYQCSGLLRALKADFQHDSNTIIFPHFVRIAYYMCIMNHIEYSNEISATVIVKITSNVSFFVLVCFMFLQAILLDRISTKLCTRHKVKVI